MTHGVSFPADADGRRSTSRAGRTVVADALRPVDPVGALGAERETAWRSGYVLHLRRLVEAGVATPEAWLSIAEAGLDAVRRTLVVTADDGTEQPLDALATAAADRTLHTHEVVGEGEAQTELVLPYRGRDLRGDDLRAQLEVWVARGVLEPSAAAGRRRGGGPPGVAAARGPDGRRPGRRRGDGPAGRPPALGRHRRGRRPAPRGPVAAGAADRPVRRRPAAGAERRVDTGPGGLGADLLAEVPEVADWLAGLEGRLVLGNYLYADGGTHVRVAAAADALATRLTAARPDTALAFLATPTDAFVVPREAVEQSTRAYRERSGAAKLVGRPLRWATRGRLLHRAYPPAADPGIADSIVPVQGPNYALAKRIQRWRAAVARRDGQLVSFHVAPSTRTRSVVKNRALAAAFAGAHRFGVEIFEPDTANTLMAALLVHDLSTEPATHDHPWQDEAYAAVHGGLWRAAYEPRSALGLAAALGYASARG